MKLLLLALLFALPPEAPCDTTWVQTFTFDSIETRRAVFDFPPRQEWRKVLALYTLKCDPATPGDRYDCGEWDVNTYLRVHHPTGKVYREPLEQPSFTVLGEAPDSLRLRLEPVYDRVSGWSGAGPRQRDRYLQFREGAFVEVPPSALAPADSALSLAFWSRGAPDQPSNGSIVEACLQGGRVLNLHLPWGTGVIFFEGGGRLQGNNNRLTKQGAPEDWKGRWTHWCFTRELRSGRMAIWRDGELWHEAGNMVKPIGPVDSFILGGNCNANGSWYDGAMDELRVYSRALDGEEIRALAQGGSVDPDGLELYYTFDGEDGRARDSSGSARHGRLVGEPERRLYGFGGQADYRPEKGAQVVRDSLRAAPLSVLVYGNPDAPRQPLDTLRAWAAEERLFDADGRLLSSRPLPADTVLHQQPLRWEGEEIIEREVFELARYITPYGKGLDLGEEGFLWLYEVSDYAGLLSGKVDLQAGNGLELLDLRFAFIEGPSPRPVLRLRNIWPEGNHNYGRIHRDEVLRPRVLDLLPEAARIVLRSRISGHGHYGPNNCCEWTPKEHRLVVNGTRDFRWTLWTNCGDNPLHPQGGTWQFDRAGWCPGRFVTTVDHELAQGGDSLLSVDYAIEEPLPDTGEEGGAYYHSQQILETGAWRSAVDLAVEEILAPSGRKEFRRFNPPSGSPVIRLRNLGGTPLLAARLSYGLEGAEARDWTWRGQLEPGAVEEVRLPPCDWSAMEEGARFLVEAWPLEGKDGWPGDNRLASACPAPLRMPRDLVIHFDAPPFGRADDNSWLLLDAAGRLRQSRDTFESGVVHRDTLRLDPGAWELHFLDSMEDGLIRHWWLRGSDPERIGHNGRVLLCSIEGDTLQDLGYDFAEGAVSRFFVE